MGACAHVSWQLRQPNRGSSQASSVNPAKHADTDRYTCDCQARKPRIDTEFAQPREPNEPTQHITFCNLSAEIFTIQANSHYHQYSTIRIGNKQQSKTKQNKTKQGFQNTPRRKTAQHSTAQPPVWVQIGIHGVGPSTAVDFTRSASPDKGGVSRSRPHPVACSSLLSSSLPPFRSSFCFSLTCRGSW